MELLRKTVSGIMLTLLLIGMSTLTFSITSVKTEQNAQLLLKTDKDLYLIGENVTIILLNVGNETLEIGGYPAWQIFTYPEEKPVYPKVFAFLAWSLNPGENDTFKWNQYNQFTETFAKPGAYIIKDTQGWGLSTFFRIIVAKITVPEDYPTIQEAINAANPRDIIYVKAGTYYEHVIVNKSVSVVGENKNYTIIDGSCNGTVITITADYVNVTEMTIRNGHYVSHVTYGIYIYNSNNVTINGNMVSDNDVGVFLYYSDNCIVSNNIIPNNYQGVSVTFGNNNSLEYNTIFNNVEGIGIGSSANNNIILKNRIFGNSFCGIQVGWSNGNNIIGNTITLNNEAGIRLDASSNNNIVGNTITLSNRDGIVLFGSNGNVITSNELIQNKWDGIAAWYSDANVIYHNNFQDNTKQAGSYTGSINTWDDGYPSGGNYWSDYTGVDEFSGPNQDVPGSDGIGDAPYIIDEHNRDRYPLVNPWPPTPDFSIMASPTSLTIQQAAQIRQ